jgi:hypothetical protein
MATVAGTASARGQKPQTPWTLEPRPAVVLGASESDTAGTLEIVVSATRLPDGSILVGDRGDFALRLFGPAGKPVQSFARKGSGPGEVRYLGSMLRCGDSVYTYDIEEGHRMSVFTVTGRYVRTFRFRSPQAAQTPYMTACNDSGDFVHLGWEDRRDMRAGVFRPIVPVWLSRADSTVGRVVDSVPGSERWGSVRDGRIRGTRPLPLGKQPVLGIGRSQVYVGSADRFQIRALGFSGRVAAVLQRPEPPVSVSKSDVRSEIEREIANRGEAARPGVERAYAEMVLPSTLPAYTSLIVDADDFVWVRPYPRGSAPSLRWSVFDSKGISVAEIDVPTHLEVFEIGHDYVLGRYLDPLEAIPQVRLYRLGRSGR